MIRPSDIHSITDLSRNTKKLVDQVSHTKNPVAITVNGQAKVILQDAEDYQEMRDQLYQYHLSLAIERGEADIQAGRVRSAEDVFSNLLKKYEV